MRRDFTKSNKHYFSKNKYALIGVAIFLVLGIVLWAVLGLNGNFELNGYTEFSIKAGADTSNYSTIVEESKEVVNSYGGDFDNYQILGEGDTAEIIIRYTKNISNEKEAKINSDIVKELNLKAEDVSNHTDVEPVVTNMDYVYTATAILLIVVITSIFAYFRYNGASALTMVITCLLGTLGYICLSAILRLSIGMSYFAMLVILNTIITYFAINIFESMHKEKWLGNFDYSTALQSALKDTKTRISIFSVAIMLVGILFVIIAPLTLKYVSLNIMFMSVVVLAAAWYVIPFVWSTLITSSRIKEYRVKATKEETNK